MVRDGTEDRGHPVFIREGIIVSDIRSPLNRGVRSLVIVEDAPLASLLGDSETPAHTQWQKDGSNYRGKYTYGPENLSFMIISVSEIVRLINEQEQEADRVPGSGDTIPGVPGTPYLCAVNRVRCWSSKAQT